MDEKIIQEQFMKGYDCSQVVLSHFAEKLGLTMIINPELEAAREAARAFLGR